MNFSHLANKLRYKITKFSGILSKELNKTARRFIQEAIYGIIVSQSVKLTEIGRQIESQVSLKKIEERFSRQLIKPNIWSCLHKKILSLASSLIKDNTLLILDLSDLKKKYAEKMEYLILNIMHWEMDLVIYFHNILENYLNSLKYLIPSLASDLGKFGVCPTLLPMNFYVSNAKDVTT